MNVKEVEGIDPINEELIAVRILILDQPNKNNRTYTTECVQQCIDTHPVVYGELGMSPFNVNELIDSSSSVDLSVNTARISHVVTNMKIKDGYWVGDVRILNTPMGRMLNQLISVEFHIDFRPRGTGNINEDGVISNYSIISIDVVSDGA